MYQTDINTKNIIDAVFTWGSDPYVIETEEDARFMAEAVNNATIFRELEGEEFDDAKSELDLDGLDVRHIYSFVNGSEGLFCLYEDYD